MYNHMLVVKGTGDDSLRMAVALAFEHVPGGTVTHYSNAGPSTLRLHWHESADDDAVELPYVHGSDEAYALIRGWLKACNESAYLEDAGGMDGSQSRKGFWLRAQEAAAYSYLCLEVSPIWCHHPK